MIIYQPNKHFFRDITHLAKSYTMVKIIRGVLIIGVFSFAICFPVEYFDLEDQFIMNPMIFSFLGVVLSILLVFRTNSAYDRWWEGRKQWGMLVNNCRNLAVQVHATFPEEDKESRHYLAVRISNFCIAFKEHLREGVKLEELVSTTQAERDVYSTKNHIPNYISYEIQKKIQDVYKGGGITGEDHLNIKVHTESLLDILGACERIKKTPIPFSYAVYLRIFIIAYSALLPFALVATFGIWTVPMVMFIFFAFLGIQLMAEEIEDPFGLDCNDLPTGTIAHNIKSNVFEILEAKSGIGERKRILYEKIF